jgi:hypothetical protein
LACSFMGASPVSCACPGRATDDGLPSPAGIARAEGAQANISILL